MLQATLTADVTYFFVVDGFNGAYGVWQFTLEALDNSTVEGSLLSGPYGLAVAGTSSTNTSSKQAECSILVGWGVGGGGPRGGHGGCVDASQSGPTRLWC